jgi:DNA-binding NarL/FixJ family response regulator
MHTCFQPLRALTRHKDPLVAAGIDAVLMRAPGIEIVKASHSSPFPDAGVAICDYDSGIAWAQHRKFGRSDLPDGPGVVVITWRDSEADVRTALQAGVGGYLLGSCDLDDLVEAVRAVARGSPYLCEVAATRVAKSLTRTPLTSRETEILRLIGNGMSNKLIAAELGIALGTVKSHARAILDKLDARCRTHATVIAAQRGLLDSPSPLRANSANPRFQTSPLLSRESYKQERSVS